MTTRDASNRQPTSTQRAMFFKRFDRVRGTAWIIAARRGQQRRECYLIPANEQDQHGAHDKTYAPVLLVVTRDSIDFTSTRSASIVAV
jgi:hypothetical protein